MKKRIFEIIGLILFNIITLGLIAFSIWFIMTSNGDIEFTRISLIIFLMLSGLAVILFTVDYIFNNKEKTK